MDAGLSVVNAHKRRNYPTLELTWDHIHHLFHVADGIELEIVRHLLFSEVSMQHVNHHFPITLY